MTKSNKYTCLENDRIDLIVKNHYGDITNLNLVISANPHLFKMSLNLKSGTVIKLPVCMENKTKEDSFSKRGPLW